MPTPLNNALCGKRIESVWKNADSVLIKVIDGPDVKIGWVDDNGHAIEGTPVVIAEGLVIPNGAGSAKIQIRQN